MNKIVNVNNLNIPGLPKLNTKSNKNKQQKTKSNNKNILNVTLFGLGVVGVAALLINCKKTDFLCNEMLQKADVTFKNSLVLKANGELFSGEIVRSNSLGEKFNIQFKDGVIIQSTKKTPDGNISWIKKYSKNKYEQNVVDIFALNKNNEVELTKRILSGKDKIVIFKGENTVEYYWFNTPNGWKRIDEFIDKGDIKNYQTPRYYYIQNGVQINTFLRDGQFRHPKDNIDRIPYEILNDSKYSEFEKDNIREIMRDNRFILDVIDELDILTQTSKTKATITVYRNAPKWWIDKAENGILKEDAFCSTSTEKGASMEGLFFGKYAKDGVTYAIHLQEGTPYFDLTDTTEKELLLPRKSRFRVINDTELEYIP